MEPTIEKVRDYWEDNPLCSFESPFEIGTKEFFDWHDMIRLTGVEYASFPLYEFNRHVGDHVLDIGCGIGWLCYHFAKNHAHITGIDITQRGLELTRRRLDFEGLSADLIQANAENLPFPDNAFDFVTSAGVLHHTPDTQAGIGEIYRVMKAGGGGMISLYYRNWLFSTSIWPIMRAFVRKIFAHVPGRQAFGSINTVDDFIRIYDGDDNPLGKAYSKSEVKMILKKFKIKHTETHYFPTRFLPFGGKILHWLQRILDSICGLMIYVSVGKD